ncbi:MAG TPA: excinuclease ABC subunit UvrC [Acidimicrobiia bacterium]|nr:excinuclease ABC subunit UvrC [Acidimicrobiia bacterium]
MERPDLTTLPDKPGVYLFKDRHGRVVYVGKAKSLKTRVSTYFGALSGDALADKTRQMLDVAESVEWIEVRTEPDSLLLENELIKQHQPRFNIRLKDDKSFPFLAVTVSEQWPRAMVMRGRKRKGTRYFGPYAHAYAIRETLDLLLRTFPIRTCSDTKFRRHERMGRPCLFAHIEKCAAPCVGEVSPSDYAELVDELLRFLEGETDDVLKRLELGMHAAADALEFERAARMRDQLELVRRAVERQEIVGERSESFDAVGLDEDPIEASVQVFNVRRGRMTGRKGMVIDKVEDVETPALVARLLGQLYEGADSTDVPREVLVPVLPEDHPQYERYLSKLRGSPVTIRVPQRGGKRRLMETVRINAKEAFLQHRLRRSSDHNARAKALMALQDALGLAEAPLRIECFDISHLQGGEIVGSMVVLEDGIPKRADYRHFKVKTLDGQDDYAAMEEVLTRRYRNELRDREDRALHGSPRRRFAYPPNLCLVDGGRGQLNVAVRVIEELGLDEEIAVASLAKRFEEVYLPDRPEPVRIARDSEALYLLQQVRDEAHRFAIEYHRKLRGKKMTKSVLDDIAGLGPTRKKRLLREYGSVKKLREASLAELKGLAWLPESVAAALYHRLHGLAGLARPEPAPDASPDPVPAPPTEPREERP